MSTGNCGSSPSPLETLHLLGAILYFARVHGIIATRRDRKRPERGGVYGRVT